MVGTLDDGNAKDGNTVDVDIELGYNVGKNVDNHVETAEGIDELKIVGFVVGNGVGDTLGRNDGLIEGLKDGDVFGFTIVDASLGLKVCDTLGNDDGSIVGAKDCSALGFRLGREVGIQEGTVVGASLGM